MRKKATVGGWEWTLDPTCRKKESCSVRHLDDDWTRGVAVRPECRYSNKVQDNKTAEIPFLDANMIKEAACPRMQQGVAG
jgi:hypothetical protein